MDAETKREFEFLRDNPHFQMRPASIEEFLGQGYLNVEKGLRKSIRQVVVDLFGTEPNPDRIALYRRGMVTGGIGIGKTTLAAIILPYFCHWTLCLRDPQEYFNLLAGSRIAFMQMSTSATQAKQVVFGDVKARVDNCDWFKEYYPYDGKWKTQIRFPKDVWIIPGDSAETTFEGYNILAGILDEADSHQVTKVKDYAEQGYTTIQSRIESRFDDRGFLLVIGQMKKGTGFAAKMYDEMRRDDEAYTSHMSIWESLGLDNPKFQNEDGELETFFFDKKRYEVVPAVAQHVNSTDVIEIPKVYEPSFRSNPMKALRDLAGIPPTAGSPFIVLTDKITIAQDKYLESYGIEGPVDRDGKIIDDYRGRDSLRRACHLDIAYSPDGDALGFAMGHVRGSVDVDGEIKPYIVIDLAMRIHAPPGRELFIGDIRRLIYHLKRDLNFKIEFCSTDGFESTDTRQQLQRNRIAAEKVSIDRDLTPYYDLRDAIYEERIEIPRLRVLYREEDTQYTEVIYKELAELEEDEKKVDHPEKGSKDVADCLAGVVFHLMGDRRYHHRTQSARVGPPVSTGTMGVGAPIPSRLQPSRGAPGAPVPPPGVAWRPPNRRV